jgi:uncharacterized damage-inducible protein DinB
VNDEHEVRAPGPGPPRRIWFERRFELGLPLDAFPDVLERVRGTPARLEERIMMLPDEALRRRYGESWTIQENVGHLLDLEPLWAGRLEELLRGDDALRPADLENRKTHEADHDLAPIDELLTAFRREREATVARLDALAPADLRRTALHPRLRQPMTVVDLFFFVAEHDDHHLARIGELAKLAG